jgi:hypothetical protein
MKIVRIFLNWCPDIRLNLMNVLRLPEFLFLFSLLCVILLPVRSCGDSVSHTVAYAQTHSEAQNRRSPIPLSDEAAAGARVQVVIMLLALCIVTGLLASPVVVSLLPFSLYVRGARDRDISYQVAFQWPWRAIGIGMRRDAQGRFFQLLWGNRCLYERKRRKKTRKDSKQHKKEKKRKRKKEKKERKKGGFSLFRDRELLSQLIRGGLRLLRDLLSCFRRPRLAGDVEIGFGDPEAMGIVSGFVYAVSPRGMMLDDLRIRPNYVDVTFTGEVDFSTGARPARIVIVFIKLIFYFPIMGLIRLSRRKKRMAKEEEVSENGS